MCLPNPFLQRRHHPLAFVASIDAPELDDPTYHHLTRSLRLKPGDQLNVSDGAGRWRLVRLTSDGIEIDGEILQETHPSTAKAVAFTPVKGDRTAWIVQKLTELNMDLIMIMETERSVVRWDEERKTRQLAKLNRTVMDACGQCRRVWIPKISFVTLSEVLAKNGAVLADPDGRSVGGDDRIIAVGPEGGWSLAESSEAVRVALPGAVLRAETAAVAAVVQLRSHG